jgi:BCCT family betaine/carnitine transporter
LLIVTPLWLGRLGGKDATPDYGYIGWFAMLFAAGMGIGLMFFGVLEPVYYFGTPWGDEPLGAVRTDFTEDGRADRRCQSRAAQRMGMAATSITGRCTPGRSMPWWRWRWPVLLQQGPAADDPLGLLPDLRRTVWGWPGHIIDTLAVFATLFGLATSLGSAPAGQCRSGVCSAFPTPSPFR